MVRLALCLLGALLIGLGGLGCGEPSDEFGDTIMVAARLDNIQLSWRGAAYGDLSGSADLVITDLQGAEFTKPVVLFGGVFGGVGGSVRAANIFDDTATFTADFLMPTLSDDALLQLKRDPLEDAGVSARSEAHATQTGSTVDDLLQAHELFGPYFGGQTAFAAVAGWDAHFLTKSPELTLTLSHPTFGFGLAVGVEWLSILQQ